MKITKNGVTIEIYQYGEEYYNGDVNCYFFIEMPPVCFRRLVSQNELNLLKKFFDIGIDADDYPRKGETK